MMAVMATKPPKKRVRYPPLNSAELARITFPVLEKFMRGLPPAQVAAGIAGEFGLRISRESVYRIVRTCVERGYLRLFPPIDKLLSDELRSYPNAAASRHDVRVVHAYGPEANLHVSAVGAEITFRLIQQLARQRGDDGRVDIAFGLGRATARVVRDLAGFLASEPVPGRLVVHAITPTFDFGYPLDTPVAAFALLVQSMPNVEFVGLNAPVFAQAADHDRINRSKPVHDAMAGAEDIDIVITSFADSSDPHGFLLDYLTRFNDAGVKALRAAPWVGDVHLCPYGAGGPLQIGAGLKPVTLFQLEDLVALASRRNKHVVMLCAPCSQCGRSKSGALLPLLREPSLRVWNHLVVDCMTAVELRKQRLAAG